MSHIAKVQVVIKDLNSLKAAAAKLGLEFVEGQATYRWFGKFVGDTALPAGVDVTTLGRCDHAIRVKGNPRAYEIGVRLMPNGSFTLLYDYWQGGYGLEAVAGKNLSNLTTGYNIAVATKLCQSKGLRVTATKNQQGEVVLIATR